MTLTDRLQAITDAARAAVAGSALPDAGAVLITNDGGQVETMEVPAAGAVVIHPLPALDFDAPRVSRVTWTLSVVCGNPDPVEMSARTLALVDILYAAGVVRTSDRCTPTDFRRRDNPAATIPGYSITHTEDHRRTS